MSRGWVRLGLLGLLIGVIGGVVAAIAIPRSASAPAVVRVREAPAQRQPGGASYVGLRRTGPIRIEAEASDPAGGPEWAVRSFLAERLAPGRGGRHVIGRNRCVQLGRIYRGRFGWIDARAVFRPATIGYRGAPIECLSRRPDMHREPVVEALQTLVAAAGGLPRLGQTVVWGIAGSAARSVDVRAGDRVLPGARGGRKVVLAVEDAKLDPTSVRATIRYPTGAPIVSGGGPRYLRQLPGLPGPIDPPARGATPFVAARAADPNGGLPYGLLAARAARGGWCVRSQPGRIVDGRVGDVDFERGTFVPVALGPIDCQGSRALGRRYPTTGGSGGVNDSGDPSSDPAPGRVARRTMPGAAFFAGQALPDVRSITIKTPRDVRTLVPSSPAHAYLVVYDGTFTSGRMQLTVTFDDGRTQRSEMPLGF